MIDTMSGHDNTSGCEDNSNVRRSQRSKEPNKRFADYDVSGGSSLRDRSRSRSRSPCETSSVERSTVEQGNVITEEASGTMLSLFQLVITFKQAT